MFRLSLFFLFTPEFPIGLLVFCSHLCSRSWHWFRESAILLPRGSVGKCTQWEPKRTSSANGTSICISSATAGRRNAPWLLVDCRCRRVNIEITCSLWLTMKQQQQQQKMCVVLSSNAQVSLFSSFPCGTGILEGSFHRASSYTWDVSCENMRSFVRLCLTSQVGLACAVGGTQLLGQTFRKRRSFCWGTKDKKKKDWKKTNTQSLPTFLCVQTTCTFLSFTMESLCVLLKTVKGGWTFKKIINAAETVAPAQLHEASKRLVWGWRILLRCTCLFYWHL